MRQTVRSPKRILSIITLFVLSCFAGFGPSDVLADDVEEKTVKFDAKRAYGYLLKICRIGTRVSGTPGMAKQQAMIQQHFEKLKCQFRYQPFEAIHPLNGSPVRMNNILISWHPEKLERIVIACHYDTRPFPDNDQRNPRGRFIGANDGASGVAFMMEMGHHMDKVKSKYGIDFVIFDGEELVYTDRRSEYFLGSTHFSEQYALSKGKPGKPKYVAGVLLDMIADKRLNIYYEKNSMRWAPQVSRGLFQAAKEVGVRELIPRLNTEVQDDHIPMNTIAGIPTCDLIDFDYPHWHTTRDIPANCSGTSMAKVSRVLVHWLNSGPVLNQRGK